MLSAQTYLTKDQKEAVGLLSIGTFLEYFDLMLYVHMAVLLNDLFFPKTDTHSAPLFAAAAFCSTYALRPLGALVFGWIGDNIGRKHTVVITTFMMAICCIVIAALPTYAEIGITASWIITVIRIIQGISSVSEITGSQLYITEITKPPVQYQAVSFIMVFAIFGSVVALGIGSLCSSYGFSWRYAFLIGALIAFVGAYARSSLRETPEFADAKRRLQKTFETKADEILKNSSIAKEKVNKITALSFFLIDCAKPVFFYLTYIHFGTFLKTNFGYTAGEVIFHNFKVGIIYLIFAIIQSVLTSIIHPLKILKVRLFIFTIFILLYQYLLSNVTTPFHLLMFQAFIMTFAPTNFPAVSVFFKHFPVFKRFTYTSVLHAVSHAMIYVVTSFGFVYLVRGFGQIGVLFIVIPICLAFAFGLYYFEKLEIKSGNYQKKMQISDIEDSKAEVQ